MYIRIHEGDTQMVHVHLIHNATHPPYTDISLPPEARQLIVEGLWTNPAHIAAHIRSHKQWAYVKTYQVQHVWKQLCEERWRLCDDQLLSARRLVSRYEGVVELFELEEIAGVTALAFGLISIGSKLKEVVEVGMDATCKWYIKKSEIQ
jgi:hypothetical protein